MASVRITLVVLAFLGITMSQTLATDYTVGDGNGWTFGFDYQAWANGKQFRVGDKLIFKYAVGAHNVIKVDQNSLKACVAPPGAETLETGNDTVELKTVGTFSYICGIGQHCSAGNMKFSVNVVA